MSTSQYSFPSCVRGYHIYQNVWIPYNGEELECVRQLENVVDRYAVSVVKNLGSGRSAVVGHLPCKISHLCSLFLRRGGEITCKITESRRYSFDLPQGGLEIPCLLIFRSHDENEVKKLKKCIRNRHWLSLIWLLFTWFTVIYIIIFFRHSNDWLIKWLATIIINELL